MKPRLLRLELTAAKGGASIQRKPVELYAAEESIVELARLWNETLWHGQGFQIDIREVRESERPVAVAAEPPPA